MNPISRAWQWQKAQMGEGGQYAPHIAMRGLGAMLLIDVAIPVGAYYAARAAGATQTIALLLATIASAIRNIQVIVKQREVDGFAAFMFVLLTAGLIASFWTGDARFMLLKGAIGGGLAGLAFTGGSALIRRPLTYQVAKRIAGSDQHSRADLQRGWDESVAFRRGMYLMTFAWGFGLIFDAIVSVVVILTMSIDASVLATTVLKVATFALLGVWNAWFVEYSRKLARRHGHLEPVATAAVGERREDIDVTR